MYALPLDERLRKAAYQRARYWSEPAFRLRCINRDRVKRGLPPLACLSEIKPSRQRNPRDAKGRFAK